MESHRIDEEMVLATLILVLEESCFSSKKLTEYLKSPLHTGK